MSDTLTEGQKLVRGESLASNNGAYTLTLQDDGNLVLASRGQALWATSTPAQDVVPPEVHPAAAGGRGRRGDCRRRARRGSRR
jgi:hypothetical protein